MAFVIKFIKGVRNHWKKSTFAAIALAYGANYTNEYIETQKLMRVYCERARSYGRQPIKANETPKSVTVILNPNANRRKAMKQFENYCAPILHLAGICIDIVQTQSEGHARTLVEKFKKSDAIIIAGGDGTISEVVTGLMRRSDCDEILNNCPVGLLPLGRTNTIATFLFPGGESLPTVTALADATLAVVEQNTRKVDLMKIEIIKEEEGEAPNKPIYALGSVEWGAYRDAQAKRDSYWVFGSLRNYVTYLFNGFKNSLSWNCTVVLNYWPPCSGCQNCYIKPSVSDHRNKRWWNGFYTQKPVVNEVDFSKIINENCSNFRTKKIHTSDLTLSTNLVHSEGPSELNLKFGPSQISYFHFVEQGWKSEKGQQRDVQETVKLRKVEILPQETEKELWLYIDKEDYEVKPIRVTLVPNALKVYCKRT